ncbi:hypothetical protein Tco_1255615 [Tanacetum coccineum]
MPELTSHGGTMAASLRHQWRDTICGGSVWMHPRYLKGTPSLGLWYLKYSGFNLKGYSDSDYAGCNMDKKAPLAEYVAAAGCCANILWMKSQLSYYDIHFKMVSIFCDNTSAIAISNNPVLHSRTKHIDIRYHFIRDHIIKGIFEFTLHP